MKWLEFKPTESLLRAEGNGLVLTSTSLRSVGCVVNVQTYDVPVLDLTVMTVSTEAALHLSFGYIPVASLKSIFQPRIQVGTIDHIIQWMNDAGLPSECSVQIRELERAGNPLYGFVDLIPMRSIFLRQRVTRIRRVSAPLSNPNGILHFMTCWNTFRVELRILRDTLDGQISDELSASLDGILDRYRCTELLNNTWRWNADGAADMYFPECQYLEESHDAWDWTITKLADLCTHSRSSLLANTGFFDAYYTDLIFGIVVRTPVWHSILAHAEAEGNLANQRHYRYDDEVLREARAY